MKIFKYSLFALCSLSVLTFLFSCGRENQTFYNQGKPTGIVASVELKPTEGNKVTGKVQFIELDKGVRIVANVEGLTPGEHGFHIHEFGDCSAPDAASAGGHFNPTKSLHASPMDLPRHIGDLGNINADSNGKASYNRIDFSVALSGTNSIIGKSVIVHEKNDDFVSQPTGNAGARLACGIIVLDPENE